MARIRIVKKPNKALAILEKLADRFEKAGSVKVGLPKDSNDYPDGTSVIMVGAVHEFGSPARNVPQRSFLRSTVQEKRRKYKRLFRKLSKKIIEGKLTTEESLNLIGLTVQTDVRAKIHDIKSPELKHREGNPLIDTGHLRQSINYEVTK